MKPAFTCPVCGRPIEGPIEQWPFFPFCGKKCRTIDLGRWLTGEYELPAVEPDLGEVEDEPS
jgi:endogenous inhibitor of DNA gyrase (YacG/DUF329 family)